MTRRRKTTARVLITLPYLLLLFILQAMVFSRLRILGVTPLLLPLAVCGAAIFSGRVYGCVIGIIAGMLTDMSFNQPTITFTLILAIIGLSLGSLSESVLQEGFPAYFVSSALTLALCAFVQTARLIFIDSAPAAVAETAVIQTGVSLVFSLPLYFVSRLIGRME